MYKLFIFLILILIILQEAITCSCIGSGKIKDKFNNSDLVTSIKVIESKPVIIFDSIIHKTVTLKYRDSIRTLKFEGDNYYEYKCLVNKIYKGNYHTDTIFIMSQPYLGGSCGEYLEIGNDYIIFCDLQNKYFDKGMIFKDFYITDRCKGNLVYNVDLDKQLQKLKKKH